jgi:hypothetical protein
LPYIVPPSAREGGGSRYPLGASACSVPDLFPHRRQFFGNGMWDVRVLPCEVLDGQSQQTPDGNVEADGSSLKLYCVGGRNSQPD